MPVRTIHIEQDTGLVAIIDTRKLDDRLRNSSALTLDLNLGTVEVKLSATKVTSSMKGNMFDADKVLSRRCLLWQGEGKVGPASHSPFDTIAAKGCRAKLPDLEPIARSIIVVDIAGCLGHVHLHWARVFDLGPEIGSEPNCVPSLHLVHICLAGVLEGIGVAAEVIAFVVSFPGHVALGVFADILVVVCDIAVVDEVREEVVTESSWDRSQGQGEREVNSGMHCGR